MFVPYNNMLIITAIIKGGYTLNFKQNKSINMRKALLFLSLCFAMSFTYLVVDQVYVWEAYALEITVPDDFKVVKNTDEEFEMKGDGMGMYMYLFEQDITVNQMDEAVVEAAIAMEMGEVDAAQVIQGDGLDGFYVEGFKDGARVMLAGMIDPKSQTNFMMVITFYDEDGVAEADAIGIINSIRSLK